MKKCIDCYLTTFTHKVYSKKLKVVYTESVLIYYENFMIVFSYVACRFNSFI